MSDILFDYAIIGVGVAGSQLALAIKNDPFFEKKRILLIDKSQKNENDKTWSFWEKGDGPWDDLVSHSWDQFEFHGPGLDLEKSIRPYQYKMIRSVDFYQYVKESLNTPQFHRVEKEVTDVILEENVTMRCHEDTFRARHVFDSRMSEDFEAGQGNALRIKQHFLGWFIKTSEPVFVKDKMSMMDFRFSYQDTTSFIYQLPTSEDSALIEFTFFTPDLVGKDVYESVLKEYISDHLNIEKYEIVEDEFGVIPMTNYRFEQENSMFLTKIGTAGGWVKASTGYSFKLTERKVARIISNLKTGKDVDDGLISKKYRVYDTLLLDILNYNNPMVKRIFSTLYQKLTVDQVFRFLNEETSLGEDLKVITSVPSKPFLRAILRQYFGI